MQFSASTSRYGSNVATNTSNSKPLLALPNTTKTWNNKLNTAPPKKQLTQKEYEDKRANNLCFIVIKKFVPGHKFEGQLFSLVVLGENEKLEEEFVDTDDSLEEIRNVMLLPLRGCDMVLEIQWLSTLGDIKCNFKELKIEFLYNHKKIAPRGTHKSVIQMVSRKKQFNAMIGTTQSELFMMCVYPNTVLSLMSAEHINKEWVKVPELSKVVEKLSDFFALPIESPPEFHS
nr:putative mitochondrial protein [Tanacetum cinerariifolium]